eukprot:COSAG01_NODE_707_length_14133_cov_34.324093_1_plen_240_part_00
MLLRCSYRRHHHQPKKTACGSQTRPRGRARPRRLWPCCCQLLAEPLYPSSSAAGPRAAWPAAGCDVTVCSVLWRCGGAAAESAPQWPTASWPDVCCAGAGRGELVRRGWWLQLLQWWAVGSCLVPPPPWNFFGCSPPPRRPGACTAVVESYCTHMTERSRHAWPDLTQDRACWARSQDLVHRARSDRSGRLGQMLCEIWPSRPDLRASQIWPAVVDLLLGTKVRKRQYEVHERSLRKYR